LACENGNMISTDPLTDADFALLDNFFLSDAAPENSMDSAMLDGFLTAIVSGPNLLMPSEWLRWVSDTENGTEAPAFASKEQAQQITGLLLQHYQHLNHTLTQTPERYKPCIYEREAEGRSVFVIEEWCMGYYAGIALDVPGWAPLLMAEPAWFSTILLHGTEDGWATRQKTQDDLDANQAHAASLPVTVRKIHAFWLQQRQAQQTSATPQPPSAKPQPVRSAAKVGRNEACPCGSGKKFKHCHANR
jgi:uncharacterized protein